MNTSINIYRSIVTRRSFLKRSASAAIAAAAVPSIVPVSVLGRNGAVAPSNRIAIGFIGTGRQALYANIPGFLNQPDAQVVAVCDVDSWRMDRARQKVETFYANEKPAASFKGCSALHDWRDLVARKDIDAVMISTPDHWHVIQAVAALKAGKDVSCEKPLTRSIAEGRLLANLVKKQNRVFCTDSEFRSFRMCRLAAELVRNQKIGALTRIITGTPKDSTLAMQPTVPVPKELDYEIWLGPAPDAPYTESRVHPVKNDKDRPGWLCIRDYADGMIANWGAHLNDIAMWANNTEHTGPVEIEATGEFPPAGNLWNIIQTFEAHFRFANGVELICRSDKPYVRFEGASGWIHINYPIHIELSNEDLLTWKPGPNEISLPSMTSEKRDFLDAVKTRRQPQYDAEGGHRNATLSHLALASIQLGRKLKWDPVAEKVIGDDAANDFLKPRTLRPPWKIES